MADALVQYTVLTDIPLSFLERLQKLSFSSFSYTNEPLETLPSESSPSGQLSSHNQVTGTPQGTQIVQATGSPTFHNWDGVIHVEQSQQAFDSLMSSGASIPFEAILATYLANPIITLLDQLFGVAWLRSYFPL